MITLYGRHNSILREMQKESQSEQSEENNNEEQKASNKRYLLKMRNKGVQDWRLIPFSLDLS